MCCDSRQELDLHDKAMLDTLAVEIADKVWPVITSTKFNQHDIYKAVRAKLKDKVSP